MPEKIQASTGFNPVPPDTGWTQLLTELRSLTWGPKFFHASFATQKLGCLWWRIFE